MGTFVICFASGFDGREGSTASVVIGHITIGANTYHGSDWHGIYQSARGWRHARIQSQTWVDTFLFDTDFIGGTILVLNTLRWFKRQASRVWISCVAKSASTLCQMLADETIRIGSARISHLAGIDTVPISACFVQRTVSIGAATNRNATHEWVTFEALIASAIGLVSLGVANSVCSAGIINEARIDTRSIHASFFVCTFRVRLATRRNAGNLRITNGAFWASTNWPVVRKEAFGPASTITRVFANSVDTGLVTGTFVISDTSWRIVQWNGYTTSVSVWHPAFSARTNHGSEGDSVHNRTDSCNVAGVEFVTRIDTFLVDASSSGRTISIDFALNNQFRDRFLLRCT